MPTLVVLLDISGSMERYARLLLHYVHGLTRRYLKVHTLTFGTRLTNITRSLQHRDPDVALQLADGAGARLEGRHAHRVLPRRVQPALGAAPARRSNAAVLLMTDGLDRDEHGDADARAAAQLRRCAHQIVWLNPLLRFDALRAARRRRARAAAACRPLPAGAQPRQPRRPRPGACGAPVRSLPSSLLATDRTIHGTARRTTRSRASSTRPGPRSTTPEMLKACIAGCESLERTGDDAYTAVVRAEDRPGQRALQGQL